MIQFSFRALARFFAHIRDVDIACPRCSTVHLLRASRRAVKKNPLWDHSLCWFRCRECKLDLILGVVAWQPPRWKKLIPSDSLPDAEQMAQWKEALEAEGFLMGKLEKYQRGAQINVTIPFECSCRPLEPRGRVEDPDCPIHGRTKSDHFE